jgi:integrase
MAKKTETKQKGPRSAPKYWVEIKGVLYARLQYKSDDGRYKIKYRRIADKRVARRTVDDMRRELEMHGEETLHSDKLTFAQLAERYEEHKLFPARYSNGVKVSGRRSLLPVKSILKSLKEHFGKKLIRSIRPLDIEAFKQQRLSTPVRGGSPRKVSSVNRELELLRGMLNFAVQNEWLIRSPFALTKGVISKAAEVERDRVLSFEEERRLLDACAGRRRHLRPLIICALDTAMRRGEMFKMVWNDVSFATNEIFIPQTNSKTEKSRAVGITPRLRAELEAIWETSPKDPNGIVFGITDTVKASFQTAREIAGLSDFRFHDCRHTATTRMIAAGCSHTEVMKITGHSQMKTFLRYLNVKAEATNKVANSLSAYLVESNAALQPISETIN